MLRKVQFLSLGIAAHFAVACACQEDPASAAVGARTSLELVDDDPSNRGSVAAFRFTSSEGKEVTESDLRGKVWIADFFFTTCSGPCPTITSQMRLLQDELVGSAVQLVSISVDPQTDTTEVLRDYAARVGADTARWWFLTGEEAATYDLIRKSFSLPVERQNDALIGFQVTHATRLVVVDGVGNVRGYYPGETPEGRAMARTRAQWLARNPGR